MDEKLSATKYGVLLTKRGLLLALILSIAFYLSYFVFAYYVPQHFFSSADNQVILQATFNIAVALTLIVFSFFIHRIDKLHVIYTYAIATSIFTALLFFVSIDILKLTFFFAIAIFFGTGQLAFLTYFWNLTVPDERGRVAGLSGLLGLLLYVIMFATVAPILNFQRAVVLGIALSLAPLAVLLLKPEKAVLTRKKDETGYYPEKRTILLYLIPWVLFSLINATFARNISFNISHQVPSYLYLFLIVLQGIGTIFGALIGGVVADFFGRKVSLASSLTLYGISSALAGVADNYALLYFVYVANGLSWGILSIMYSLVIWGDLSNKENCAKIYSIGFMIFYITQGAGFLPLKQIFEIPLVVSSLFSCLLIFISNIPIFLAPELLPSDFREKIKIKLHMNSVKKIKQSRNQG
ncbi:MAG: MFS transporter [Candidatus Bathyarchaeota archaeon]|nr:MFS transporter [Candidatus Bathyarchaeota archaeon]